MIDDSGEDREQVEYKVVDILNNLGNNCKNVMFEDVCPLNNLGESGNRGAFAIVVFAVVSFVLLFSSYDRSLVKLQAVVAIDIKLSEGNPR